jgi:phage protein U
MAVGSLGNISFEVSANMIRTFDELKRGGSARFAYHSRQNAKELPEFLGPSAETLSFNIRLSAYEGVNPSDEAKALRAMRDNGEAVLFVLDGEPQGEGYWIIESVSEDHDHIDNRGRPTVITCAVSLKEYLPTRE